MNISNTFSDLKQVFVICLSRLLALIYLIRFPKNILGGMLIILSGLFGYSVQAVVSIETITKGTVEYSTTSSIDVPLQNEGNCDMSNLGKDDSLSLLFEVGTPLKEGHTYEFHYKLSNGATFSELQDTSVISNNGTLSTPANVKAERVQADSKSSMRFHVVVAQNIPASTQFLFCPSAIRVVDQNPVNIFYELFDVSANVISRLDSKIRLFTATGELLKYTAPTVEKLQVAKADFTVSATADPLTVTLDASKSSTNQGAQIVSYTWTSSDGQTTNGVISSLAFKKAGNYSVELTTTDSNSDTLSTKQEIKFSDSSVLIPVSVAADFTVSPTVKTPLTVELDASATLSACDKKATTYKWESSDGQTANGVSPSFTFDQPGEYKLTLIVTNNECGSSMMQQMLRLPEYGCSGSVPDGCPVYSSPVSCSNFIGVSFEVPFVEVYDSNGVNYQSPPFYNLTDVRQPPTSPIPTPLVSYLRYSVDAYNPINSRDPCMGDCRNNFYLNDNNEISWGVLDVKVVKTSSGGPYHRCNSTTLFKVRNNSLPFYLYE